MTFSYLFTEFYARHCMRLRVYQRGIHGLCSGRGETGFLLMLWTTCRLELPLIKSVWEGWLILRWGTALQEMKNEWRARGWSRLTFRPEICMARRHCNVVGHVASCHEYGENRECQMWVIPCQTNTLFYLRSSNFDENCCASRPCWAMNTYQFLDRSDLPCTLSLLRLSVALKRANCSTFRAECTLLVIRRLPNSDDPWD